MKQNNSQNFVDVDHKMKQGSNLGECLKHFQAFCYEFILFFAETMFINDGGNDDSPKCTQESH